MFAHAARAARAAGIALLCACLGVPPAFAAAAASKSGSHRSSSTKGTSSKSGASSSGTSKSGTAKPRASAGGSSSSSSHTGGSHRAKAPVQRDAKGRIARSKEAKAEFMKQSGFPHGRPGYVVDHKIPLACGGADSPSNMQWQSKADAAAKDKVERRGC